MKQPPTNRPESNGSGARRNGRLSGADVVFGLYCLAALAGVTWPVYPALGNRIEPFVAGLPFSLAWITGWVIATFIALVLYERAVSRRG